MSRAGIISEIPKLSLTDRRVTMRCLLESEEAAATLADFDQRRLVRFQVPNALEAKDEKNAARWNLAR